MNAATLLAEAEALMNTCRELIHQSLSFNTQDRTSSRDWPHSRDSDSAIRFNSVDSAKLDGRPSDPQSDGTSPQVNLDILEMVVSQFPELIRGTAVFFAVLIEQNGRIVSHNEMRAILGSNSQAIMKVHASKIRRALRVRDIDVPVTYVKGGYGLSAESVTKIYAELNFTASENEKIDH
jgi:hypothetical protein